MPLTVLPGGKVFADRTGPAPSRVVALHGWGRDRSDFAAALAGFDALAVDLPGFGTSAPPESAGGAGMYARILAPALEGEVDAPVVVGHSFGGRVALHMATAVGARGVVLTGVPIFRSRPPKSPPPAYRAIRALHRRGLLTDATMERIRRRRGSTDYKNAKGVMRDVLVTVVNEEYGDLVRTLDIPVALVWGADDAEVPPAVAERAADERHRAVLSVSIDVVAGVGHMLPLEAPDALRAAIERLLR